MAATSLSFSVILPCPTPSPAAYHILCANPFRRTKRIKNLLAWDLFLSKIEPDSKVRLNPSTHQTNAATACRAPVLTGFLPRYGGGLR